MKLSLIKFNEEDLIVYQDWLKNMNAKKYLFQFYPKHYCKGKDVQNPDYYLWFIIQADMTDVGTIWLEKTELKEKTIRLGIVLGDERLFNRKIGRSAIALALAEAKKREDISSVQLHVRSNNPRAIHCYRHFGFQIVKRGIKLNRRFQLIRFYRMALNLIT